MADRGYQQFGYRVTRVALPGGLGYSQATGNHVALVRRQAPMFEGEQVLQKVFDWVRGDFSQPEEWPVCPVHHEPMELFRTVGTPTRFTDQESVRYTLLFRCPVDLCNESQERDRLRSQIPVPGETTARPSWAKRES